MPDLVPATIARFAFVAVFFCGFAATFICLAVSAMRFSSVGIERNVRTTPTSLEDTNTPPNRSHEDSPRIFFVNRDRRLWRNAGSPSGSDQPEARLFAPIKFLQSRRAGRGDN
jgi:hypothetical protein